MAITRQIECHENGRVIKLISAKGTLEYDFREIDEETLLSYRMSEKTGIVMKEGEKLFFSESDKNAKTLVRDIPHMCGKVGCECKRLSAASDENGGCAKVRDASLTLSERNNKIATKRSKRIEKYPFVECGFEMINNEDGFLVIAKCSNYEKVPPRSTDTSTLSAPHKMWEEDDIRRRKEAEARKYLI